MKEYGKAVAVKGGRVTIAMKRNAGCEKCGRCVHQSIAFGDNSDLVVEAFLGESSTAIPSWLRCRAGTS